MHRVEFGSGAIKFSSYPYPGASVFPNGGVPFCDIRDFDPDCTPPEVRLLSGETLFIPATQKDELLRAADRSALRYQRRVDVWDLLLEPFLDTRFDKDHKERTFLQLEASGICRQECTVIRRRVGMRMVAYNAIHWDWVHLGLADVLEAHLPAHALRWLAFFQRRFIRFYWYAMAVADKGNNL